MGNEYVARKKNEPMNHSKSYSPNKSYIEVPNPPIQSVRQFKTNDKSEYSDVIQLNVSGLNGYLYDKFNKVKEESGMGEALKLEMQMPAFETTLFRVPTTSGVIPNQGNHIFNALGNSLWNFWDELIKNINGDDTFKAYVKHRICNKIDINLFVNLKKACDDDVTLRINEELLYHYAISSNNQITYALYSIKYFYDCTQLVMNAMNGTCLGTMYDFNVNQAIDQPALNAQANRTTNSGEFNRAKTVYETNRNKMITLFTYTINEVASYIWKAFNRLK